MPELLMTPDGKKVKIDMQKDFNLYDAPHNPPNTGTSYTAGTDLYAHKARSGNMYYYTYYWSMWQGAESELHLIDEDDAKDFILERISSGGDYISSGVDEIACQRLWGDDFFDEDA